MEPVRVRPSDATREPPAGGPGKEAASRNPAAQLDNGVCPKSKLSAPFTQRRDQTPDFVRKHYYRYQITLHT
eukprot:3954468-Pyramimonas_sp.AAC.1